MEQFIAGRRASGFYVQHIADNRDQMIESFLKAARALIEEDRADVIIPQGITQCPVQMKPKWLSEARPRMRREPFLDPSDIVRLGHAVVPHGIGFGKQYEFDAIHRPCLPVRLMQQRRRHIRKGLAIAWQGRVKKHKVADALRGTIRHTCDNHAAIAVAAQDDVVQILVLENVDDIGDLHIEIDVRPEQV